MKKLLPLLIFFFPILTFASSIPMPRVNGYSGEQVEPEWFLVAMGMSISIEALIYYYRGNMTSPLNVSFSTNFISLIVVDCFLSVYLMVFCGLASYGNQVLFVIIYVPVLTWTYTCCEYLIVKWSGHIKENRNRAVKREMFIANFVTTVFLLIYTIYAHA